MDRKLHELLSGLQRMFTSTHQTKIAMSEIQRGKANLALLMTLPTAERDFWLIDKTRDQSFFEIPGGSRIYYRDSADPINHMRREYLNTLDRAFKDILEKSQSSLYRESVVDHSDKKALVNSMIAAASYVLQSLQDLQIQKKHCIGEICDSEGNVIKDRDLVDIYAQNHGFDRYTDSVKSVFNHFNLSEDIFTPVPIDERTNWSVKICSQDRQEEFRDPLLKSIIFGSHRTILGSIIVDDERGLIPRTVWRKGLHSKGLMLNIPFPAPMPLWNLPSIQDYPERTVILSDDLVAAFNAQEKIAEHLQEEKGKKREAILRDNIYVPKPHNYDLQFEKKLMDAVLKKINVENFPLDTREQHDDSAPENLMRTRGYWTARLAFVIDKDSHATDPSSLRYPNNLKFIYNRLVNDDNKSTYDDNKYIQSVWSVPERFKEIANQQTPPCFNNATPGIGEYIEELYKIIQSIIAEYKVEDEAKLKKAEQKIESADNYFFSSWFGGSETISKINWKPLRNRTVVYAIQKHDLQSYTTAVRVSFYLAPVAGKLGFYDPFVSKKECFDGEELRKIAKSEFMIDYDSVPHNTKVWGNKLNTFGEETKIEPIQYVLDKVISKRSTTLLYAPSGVGKTWFSLCLAQALCHGTSVFENDQRWRTSRKQRVVYIDSEMNQANFYRRLTTLEEIYKRHSEDSYPLRYKQVAPLNLNLVKDEEEDQGRTQIDDWLASEEKDGRPVDLLILDNFSTLSGFNDTAKAWDNLSKWLKELNNKRQHPIACIVVHHSNKQGEQRGSSAKTATVDNVICLEAQHDEKEKDSVKKYKKRGCLNFIVRITKGRDIPDISDQDFCFPVELNLNKGKVSCTIVKPSKTVEDRKQDAMEYLDGTKKIPHEAIAILTGLSVNTIKMYSHKRKKD